MKTYHSNSAEARRPSRSKNGISEPRIWVYKGLKPHYIPLPADVDWVIYFAFVGSNLDFAAAVLKLIGTHYREAVVPCLKIFRHTLIA